MWMIIGIIAGVIAGVVFCGWLVGRIFAPIGKGWIDFWLWRR